MLSQLSIETWCLHCVLGELRFACLASLPRPSEKVFGKLVNDRKACSARNNGGMHNTQAFSNSIPAIATNSSIAVHIHSLVKNKLMTMKKLTRIALLTFSAAALVACGGGGSDSSPNTPVSPSNPRLSVNEVPLQTQVSNPYPTGSIEANSFDHVNQLRAECGFGKLSGDGALTATARNHARYLTVQAGDTGNSDHRQTNRLNPWFKGEWPTDRAIAERYIAPWTVSEGLSIYTGFNPATVDFTGNAFGLLNAPYHALDLLAPRLHLAVGAEWASKFGATNIKPHPATSIGFEWGAIVNNYGTSTDARGLANVQSLPTGDVLTWPCNGTSTPIYGNFWGEIPDPLPGRDQLNHPVGAPFYFVARLGSDLKITSAKLTNVQTGMAIPLMPVRHMKTEIYPGTTSPFAVTHYMDSAFVFPDVRLPVASTLRMDFTAELNGKSVSKSVTYRTR